MTTRAEQIAAQFEAINREAISLIEQSTSDQWQQPSVGEGWTVAAVAHHYAEVQQAFTGMVEGLAAGATFSPSASMDNVHESNAQHAREHAEAGKGVTLDLARGSMDTILARIRPLTDAQLDRAAGVFGGNELTVAQVLEYVVVGHAREHMESIRATLAAPVGASA